MSLEYAHRLETEQQDSQVLPVPSYIEVNGLINDFMCLSVALPGNTQELMEVLLKDRRADVLRHGIELAVYGITPTPESYVSLNRSAYMQHLAKGIDREELKQWSDRMFDHGFTLFGAAWINYQKERRSVKNTFLKSA